MSLNTCSFSLLILESPLLRLMNGSSRCSGRFEVFHNEQWGTVCDKTWDLQDAAVVCRDLGCGMVVSAPGSAYFGQGSDRIWLDDVNCTGTEAAFSECRVRLWGEKNCHHGEDAGVVCTGNPHGCHPLWHLEVCHTKRDAGDPGSPSECGDLEG